MKDICVYHVILKQNPRLRNIFTLKNELVTNNTKLLIGWYLQVRDINRLNYLKQINTQTITASA